MSVVVWLAVLVAAVFWALPFVFMFFTSIKSQQDIFHGSPFLPPSDPAWNNFPDAVRRGDLLTAGFNSLVIAVIKVPLGLAVSSLAAFALARLRFRRQRLLLAAIVLGTMVPIQIAVAPLFRIIYDLGLLNTHAGVILPYIAFGIPFQVFVLYGAFRAIPRELDEAARIDGAGNGTLFVRVVLPLSRPVLGALFILDFVATWNEFAIALAILQSKASYTVPLALQAYNAQFTSSYGQLNAAIILTMLPVLIVFLLFQRYFVSGAFSGAVKG
jgi:raffinose/stachyose/melibiose transport system permease protein